MHRRSRISYCSFDQGGRYYSAFNWSEEHGENMWFVGDDQLGRRIYTPMAVAGRIARLLHWGRITWDEAVEIAKGEEIGT